MLHILARNNQEKSWETLVQFGEHKTSKKKSRETVVQFGEHKTFREESGDRGAIRQAQNIRGESGDCGTT